MQPDPVVAAGYAARSPEFERERFLALFSGDAARAARALWAVVDPGADADGRGPKPDKKTEKGVARVLASEAALQLLGSVAAEIPSERVLALLRRLAAEPGPLGHEPPYGSKTQPYPGWSVALENLVRALPERRALLAAWAELASPIGPALGFALARLGELRDLAALARLLEPFAARAAARYTWCPEGFTDAERAFGEAAWRRAVVACAASPAIEKVGMWASHFAPFAPHASDEELFVAVRKLTWDGPEVPQMFGSRGPGMAALLEREADAARQQIESRPAHYVYGAPDFALGLYARDLTQRGEPLPERFDPVLRRLLRSPSRPTCVWPLLRALPAARRDALLLEWARSLDLNEGYSQDYDELTAFATPELARWAAAALFAGAESYWLESHLADFGPETVPALAEQLARDEAGALAAGPERLQWTVLACCARFPSETAAELAAELAAAGAHERAAVHAAEVLSQQPLDALLRQIRARWTDASPAGQERLAQALAARCFEPEVRELATELSTPARTAAAASAEAGEAIRRALLPATDAGWPLPEPIRAFVAAARALPDALKEQAAELARGRPRDERTARAEPPLPVARAALYQAVVRGRQDTPTELAARLAGEDEGALWFFVLCGWSGSSPRLYPVVQAAGARLVAPLLALWQAPLRRARLSDEGRAYLLDKLGALEPAAVFSVLERPEGLDTAELHRPLRAALLAALDDPAQRPRAVERLEALLQDRALRGLALELLSAHAVPELAGALERLGTARLRKTERALCDRALGQARPARTAVAATEPAAAAAPSALVWTRLSTLGSGAVTRVERVDTVIAAATASELLLLGPAGQVRGRVPGLAGESSLWQVGPDGGYVAVLEESGVALYHGDGRLVELPPEGDDEDDDGEGDGEDDGEAREERRLYPNDGLSGLLPLGPRRLLVWAIGHNVYQPLTLYDPTTGEAIASRDIKGFATDAAVLPGCEHFVAVTMDGALELRASADGKRLKQLGKATLAEDAWPLLRVVDGGATLLVLSTGRVAVLRRQASGRYTLAAELLLRADRAPDGSTDAHGVVLSSPQAARFVLRSGPRAEVYTAAGALQGVLDLAAQPGAAQASSTPPDRSLLGAVAGSRLGLSDGGALSVYDLERLALCDRVALDSPITALAGDAAGFLVGTASGDVLACG